MNERELSLIKALGEEFAIAIGELKSSFEERMLQYKAETEQQIKQLQLEFGEIKELSLPELPDFSRMVDDVVAKIPVPQDGKSVTVEELTPVIQGLVLSSMPPAADVKSLMPDVISLVKQAVSEMPEAAPGMDGRDALALEVHPCIDEQKSYPRGSYATHDGGLWRAYEKTHGMRGWECIVDGLSAVDVSLDRERHFTVTLSKASGNQLVREFDVPVMLYRGTFKSGEVYTPGDTVTWGGSLWHCDKQTQDKPGEHGSAGWTLAAKRGRDARARE